MKKGIGWMMLIALVAGLLVGCAGKPDNTDKTVPETEAIVIEESTKRDDDSSEAWPRTYVDVLGREIVLEKKPERVALLFFRNFEHMFLLGEFPIAAANVDVLQEWASLSPYEAQHTITDLGSIVSPNVEKMIELDLDLIIMHVGRYGDQGENLEKIAPVITVDSNENEWQTALREYGEIFGIEAKAETEIARIEAIIADSREQLQASNDQTFAVVMLGENQLWAYTTQFIYNKENGLGLNPPNPYVDMATKGEQITLEGLAEMNPDYIFVADISGSIENLKSHLSRLEEVSVWSSLEAVKKGQLYSLDSSISAGGPLGIELGVNTIIERILGN